MAPSTPSDALIRDLAGLYGWAHVTPGAHLALARSFAGFTRIDIAGVAAALHRTSPPVTPTKLAEALRSAASAHRRPSPDPVDTVAVPTHPPSCQCEGTGTLITGGLSLIDPETGERLSSRTFRSARPCPGNGGRPMTRQQWERIQAEERTAGRQPTDYRDILAQARAKLDQPTNQGDDNHDRPPPAA